MTLLADVVSTSTEVAATRARTAKIDALARLLKSLDADEVVPVVGFLSGSPHQGKVGLGWSSVYSIAVAHADGPSLVVSDLDQVIDKIGVTVGPGSAGARRAILDGLLSRATAAEAEFIRRLLVGELRQGALEGLMLDAIAKAASVPAATARRAAMLSGDLGTTAVAALGTGEQALHRVGLVVLRPVLPMLASSSPDVAAALGATGVAAVEWKFDGIRIQVHRDGDDVRIYTRNLNDVTEAMPQVVGIVRSLSPTRLILDGEAVGMPYFFDCLHVDGADLIDEPLSARRDILRAVAGDLCVPGVMTADPGEAQRVLDEALAAGHEGVVVKAASSTYEAGRRGKSWRKVKPVRTLDLVVLAAEWGHGRRRGWLSNLHLGARDTSGGFVMLGKTFKGMTDELLAWQTTELQKIALRTEGITVHVRPEMVVEVAFDGVSASPRYPGGVGLRFARIRRYRPDKAPADADTIGTVRSFASKKERG